MAGLLNDTTYSTMSRSSNTCTAALTLSGLNYTGNFSCVAYNFSLAVDDARLWFEDGVEVGRVFTVQDEPRYMMGRNFFTARTDLNSTGFFYSISQGVVDIGYELVDENIFYYSGDFYNNGTNQEIIN